MSSQVAPGGSQYWWCQSFSDSPILVEVVDKGSRGSGTQQGDVKLALESGLLALQDTQPSSSLLTLRTVHSIPRV